MTDKNKTTKPKANKPKTVKKAIKSEHIQDCESTKERSIASENEVNTNHNACELPESSNLEKASGTQDMNLNERKENNKPRSARTRSREAALQALYAWQLSGDHSRVVGDVLEARPDIPLMDQQYYVDLVYGIIEEHELLDELIEPWLDRPLLQLSLVEHMILWVGLYEMTRYIDIPGRVILNEAIELAKVFGGKDSYKYINATLDNMGRRVRPTDPSLLDRKRKNST